MYFYPQTLKTHSKAPRCSHWRILKSWDQPENSRFNSHIKSCLRAITSLSRKRGKLRPHSISQPSLCVYFLNHPPLFSPFPILQSTISCRQSGKSHKWNPRKGNVKETLTGAEAMPLPTCSCVCVLKSPSDGSVPVEPVALLLSILVVIFIVIHQAEINHLTAHIQVTHG